MLICWCYKWQKTTRLLNFFLNLKIRLNYSFKFKVKLFFFNIHTFYWKGLTYFVLYWLTLISTTIKSCHEGWLCFVSWGYSKQRATCSLSYWGSCCDKEWASWSLDGVPASLLSPFNSLHDLLHHWSATSGVQVDTGLLPSPKSTISDLASCQDALSHRPSIPVGFPQY